MDHLGCHFTATVEGIAPGIPGPMRYWLDCFADDGCTIAGNTTCTPIRSPHGSRIGPRAPGLAAPHPLLARGRTAAGLANRVQAVQKAKLIGATVLAAHAGFRRQRAGLPFRFPAAAIGDTEILFATGCGVAAHALV